MIPTVGMEKKMCFLLFVHESVFFGVVSHLTRDLCLFIKPYVFFHTSSIHGGEFGMVVKKNQSELFSFRGKSHKACFSVDIDSRDRSLFLTRLWQWTCNSCFNFWWKEMNLYRLLYFLKWLSKKIKKIKESHKK